MTADSQTLNVTGKVGDKDYSFQIEAADWFNYLHTKDEIQLNSEEILDKKLLRHYPAIALIYELATSAYETSSKRMDIINSRLESLLIFFVTANGIIIGATAKGGISYQKQTFYLAMTIFFSSLLLGTIGRLNGKLIVLRPRSFLEKASAPSGGRKWETLKEFAFKQNFIDYSASDFEKNLEVINDKWLISVFLNIFFALEIIFICYWLTSS